MSLSKTERSPMNISGGWFMKTKKIFRIYFIAVAVLSLCIVSSSFAFEGNRNFHVKVMTRNMYPGADPAVIAIANESNFEQVVGGMITSIFESRPEDRAALLAAEIARTKPDLIALQEATTWKIDMVDPPVEINQLDLLMKSLRMYGQHYRIAAIQKLTDVVLPGVLSYTDHDVILVRSDVHANQLRVLRSEAHRYGALMEFPVEIPGMEGSIQVVRGWIAADIQMGNSRFKFVNTHLESPIPGVPETKYLQELQAAQLMEDLDEAKLPIILVGDFNSDAEHTNNYPSDNTGSYDDIVASGFIDAWDELRPKNPGYTWSLFPVDGIAFEPFERIDLIFSNGPKPISVMRTGMEPVDGLYTSDHAGVVAVFDLADHQPSHHRSNRIYRDFPEYFGFQFPADQLRHLRPSDFRRH